MLVQPVQAEVPALEVLPVVPAAVQPAQVAVQQAQAAVQQAQAAVLPAQAAVWPVRAAVWPVLVAEWPVPVAAISGNVVPKIAETNRSMWRHALMEVFPSEAVSDSTMGCVVGSKASVQTLVPMLTLTGFAIMKTTTATPMVSLSGVAVRRRGANRAQCPKFEMAATPMNVSPGKSVEAVPVFAKRVWGAIVPEA